tara:strand:+ start:188 stop:589 length:402 start_codon:yes stop_codon:yes gene_type:complete
MTEIILQHVRSIPKELEPEFLYVSLDYGVAAHLCACGCGNKVVVPLGPAEWRFSELDGKPTLSPSIGNWQLPCRSHYVIRNGHIHWSGQWSEEQVLVGRKAEQARRKDYYTELARERVWWRRVWKWLLGLVRR